MTNAFRSPNKFRRYFILMAACLLLSARFGTHPNGDPLILFCPLLFIAGLLTCFASSVTYEAVPDTRPAHNQGG